MLFQIYLAKVRALLTAPYLTARGQTLSKAGGQIVGPHDTFSLILIQQLIIFHWKIKPQKHAEVHEILGHQMVRFFLSFYIVIHTIIS